MNDLTEATTTLAAAVTGRRVQLIRAGTANGYLFTANALQNAVPLFDNLPAFIDHASAADAARPGGRSVRDYAGQIANPQWDPAAAAVVADLNLAPHQQWIQQLADTASPNHVGLSAVLYLQHRDHTVHAITRVESVDIVVNPAAGGSLRPAQGAPNTMAQDQPNPAPAQPDPAPAPNPAPAAELDALKLELSLARSGLPEAQQNRLRPILQALPDQARQDALDAFRAAQRPHPVANLGRVEGMLTPLDKVELAFEALMGIEQTPAHRAAPRLTGIRELYDLLTGDYERRGAFQADRVQLANATTSTMANVCANVLGKVMLKAFTAGPRWWQPIAYEEDFPTTNDARWITIGGFTDLPTVNEGAPYTEQTWDDYAETSAFHKKGNYIGLTLEMIDRDDVQAVRAIPRRLGHAAYRTLSADVAALFTAPTAAGVVLADGKALFHTDHHNLADAELAAPSWAATVAAMFKQQEYNSAKRLGVRPRYCLVPIELEPAALEIFTSEVVPSTGAFYRNVLQRSADSVVVVPDWTDADDWAAAADPAELEGVCIGYRYGRAPEIFVADDAATGSMFTNDEMRLKVRFIYTVGIGDYRALYKHIVI